MDSGEEIDCGSGLGWEEGGEGKKEIGTTVIEKNIKN